jgi:hypothetical protein
MGYINDLLAKLNAMNVQHIAQTIFVATEESLEEIQRSQMEHGLNADGEPIGQYKQEWYADRKNMMNPLAGYGQVDLKHTGRFYDNITVAIINDELIIESTDGKNEALIEKYGENIFGINEDFKQRYIDEDLRPEFKKEIQKATGLRFPK